jgi:hypothetical protein
MKTITLVFFTLIILLFNKNSVSSELTSTDEKLKTHLLSKSNDFETLLSILSETKYTKILWIKDGPLNAGFKNNENIVWDKTPQLESFINKATELGFGSFLIGKDNNDNWLISTGDEVVLLDDVPTKVKTIKSSYWYGVEPEHTICTSELVNTSFDGTCYIPLLKNWFLYKYWFTYSPPIEKT